MPDSLDNPRICKTPAYSASTSNLRFMVVGADASGNEKREVGTFTIDQLTALFPAPQSISVNIDEQAPSFDGGVIKLSNPPTLTLRTSGAPIASGRFYDFASGSGTNSVIYIAKNTSIAHAPIDGYQTLRWVVSKWNDTNVETEPTNTVIFIPVTTNTILRHADPAVVAQSNGAVPRYRDNGILDAKSLKLFYQEDPELSFGVTIRTNGILTTRNEEGNITRIFRTESTSSSSVGDHYLVGVRCSTINAGSIEARCADEYGRVFARMTSAQRDELTPNHFNFVIYNTDTGELNFHNGTAWRKITSEPV